MFVGAKRRYGSPFEILDSTDRPVGVLFNEVITAKVLSRFAFCSAKPNPVRKARFWANTAAGTRASRLISAACIVSGL